MNSPLYLSDINIIFTFTIMFTDTFVLSVKMRVQSQAGHIQHTVMRYMRFNIIKRPLQTCSFAFLIGLAERAH